LGAKLANRIDHHWYGVVHNCCNPSNPSDKRFGLEETADTNGAGIASNTVISNVDILRLRCECTAGLDPDRDVVASAGVVLQGEPTHRGVTNAIDVAWKRSCTMSGIASAGRVGDERTNTSCRVIAARVLVARVKAPKAALLERRVLLNIALPDR
jgi:hypothetical protein